ncbi:MAG TPA: hypothetical protein EYQ50_07280 [Verrucomicrobiales bacterium]|nr:hypothetical protein [Verrucomicrobiales bacterium]
MAWLYQRGAVWWVGYRVNGILKGSSTGKNRKTEAEKVLHQFKMLESAKKADALTLKFYEDLTGDKVRRTPIRQAFNEWLSAAKGSISDSTFEKYRGISNQFLQFVKADDFTPLASEITTGQVQRFLEHRRQRHSLNTANLDRKIMSFIFKRFSELGLIKNNPAAPGLIRKFIPTDEELEMAEETKRRPFTTEEAQKAYAAAPNDFWRYMIIGGFYTGMRLGDVICLRIENINFEIGCLEFRARKTRTRIKDSARIPISPRFKLELEKIAGLGKSYKISGYLWPEEARIYQEKKSKYFSNQFYELVLMPSELVQPRDHQKKDGRSKKKRKGNQLSFHSFRHSFATMLQASGASKEINRKLLGHHSDIMNDLYIHTDHEILAPHVQALPTI